MFQCPMLTIYAGKLLSAGVECELEGLFGIHSQFFGSLLAFFMWESFATAGKFMS